MSVCTCSHAKVLVLTVDWTRAIGNLRLILSRLFFLASSAYVGINPFSSPRDSLQRCPGHGLETIGLVDVLQE